MSCDVSKVDAFQNVPSLSRRYVSYVVKSANFALYNAQFSAKGFRRRELLRPHLLDGGRPFVTIRRNNSTMTYKELERMIRKLGWKLERFGDGSHRFFSNPDFDYEILLPSHGSKEIPKGTCERILKDAHGNGKGRQK